MKLRLCPFIRMNCQMPLEIERKFLLANDDWRVLEIDEYQGILGGVILADVELTASDITMLIAVARRRAAARFCMQCL